jgi:hypothetical protein
LKAHLHMLGATFYVFFIESIENFHQSWQALLKDFSQKSLIT